MNTRRECRKIIEEKSGQVRLFISTNGSSLLFTPSVDCFGMNWSTKDPAVLALRTLLKRELTENPLEYSIIQYGKPRQTIVREPGTIEIVEKFFDLTDAYETYPDNPANHIEFSRFDFSARGIALDQLEPDFKLTGMSYTIFSTIDQASAADIQALRQAFLDTAEDSIKAELDWALEALTP